MSIDTARCKFNKRKISTFYQIYMKKNVPKFKITYPSLTHREVFRLCALNWKISNENPKNQK